LLHCAKMGPQPGSGHFIVAPRSVSQGMHKRRLPDC
jgi:hypothetical protein